MRPKARAALIFVGAALTAAAVAAFPGRIVYWESDDKIQSYLLRQTPLGASQGAVLDWLKHNGTPGQLKRLPVEPNSSYPPTRVGGDGFIHESVASYWVVFRTDIEVFYIFDNGKLVDLTVRTTTDSL